MLHEWERVATGAGSEAVRIDALQRSLHRVLNCDSAREWLLSRSARYEHQLSLDCDYSSAPDAVEPETIDSSSMLSSVAFSYVVTTDNDEARSFISCVDGSERDSIANSGVISAGHSNDSVERNASSDSSSGGASVRSMRRPDVMETLLVPKALIEDSFVLGSVYMQAPHKLFPFPAEVVPARVRRFVVDLAAEDGALVLILLTWYSNKQSVFEIRRIDKFGEYHGLYLWFASCESGAVPSVLMAKAYFTDAVKTECLFCSMRKLSNCQCPVEFRRRSGHRPVLPPRGAAAWSCWASQLCRSRSMMTPMRAKVFDAKGTLLRSLEVFTSMHFLQRESVTLTRLRREYTTFILSNFANLLHGSLHHSPASSGSKHHDMLEACDRNSDIDTNDVKRPAKRLATVALGGYPIASLSASTLFDPQLEQHQELGVIFPASSNGAVLDMPHAYFAQGGLQAKTDNSAPNSRGEQSRKTTPEFDQDILASLSHKPRECEGLANEGKKAAVVNIQGLIGVEHIVPIDVSDPEGASSCTVCGSQFAARCDALEHVFDAHIKLSDTTCPVCSRGFSTGSNVRQHIRLVHLDKRPHKCTECGAAFKISSKLRRHVKTVHASRPKQAETRLDRVAADFNTSRKRPHGQLTGPHSVLD